MIAECAPLELEQGKRYSQATGESKAFLRSFIKRIEVNGNQVRIDYKPPSSARYSSREVTEVLPIVNPGGAEGTRTPDLLRAKEALSQLSYSPVRYR